MRFVGIIVSVPLSGSYYNGGAPSDINALKTSKSMCHSVRTSQRTTRAWSINHCLLLQYK